MKKRITVMNLHQFKLETIQAILWMKLKF